MKIFETLLQTNSTKRKYQYDFKKIYRKGRFATSVDYDYFEDLFVQELSNANKKKKYNENLVTLWAKLDMRSYIDFDLGNTVNLYFCDNSNRIPINQLENYNYMYEDTRKLNLLNIMYVKHLSLNGIKFNNLYIAVYDILDTNNVFRPYILVFTKNDSNNFVEIGYGYDSNNNGNVEIFMDSFNYPVFLTPKGYIISPLIDQKIKLNVYDYITDTDIEKIMD